MEFHKDEVKNKVVWTKGADITDGSPRYTFEGRDPATTYERFQVVIYTERERRYAHDPGSLCNHYYGYVRDDKMECAEKPLDRTILSRRQSGERWNCSICLCSNTPLKN